MLLGSASMPGRPSKRNLESLCRTPENAELKPLNGTPRCCVFMATGIDQPKPFSQLRRKARRIVSVDGQAAASFRAIDREAADDNVSAGFDRLLQARDVCRTVIGVCEEVESRPIVPDVIGLGWLPCGHIGRHPLHIWLIAETSFRSAQCRLRKIQDRHVVEPARDQAINKT